MTPPISRGAEGAGHARARELAAARPDGFLGPDEEAWLDGHLGHCDACSLVAAEYAGQRDLFATGRMQLPQAPRDLWARTAATIEADRGGRSPRGARRRFGSWVYAPLAGAVVLTVVVGAGLLDGLPARESTSKGEEPDATPFALAAGEVVVLSPGADGMLEVRRERVDEVCPVGAESCGLNPTTEVTQVERLADASTADAYFSPDQDQMVVIERGGETQGVYIVQVREPGETSPPSPTLPPTASPATPSPAASDLATPSASVLASVAPESGAPVSPGPSIAPPTAPVLPSGSPVVPPIGSSSASPSPSLAASLPPSLPSEDPTPDPTPEPSPEPTPSVQVTPRPDGAIEIARDVILVGSAAGYSPDGARFAFSARPSDRDAGPDVYVWESGDERATAVTDDGSSLFAGWLGDELLISRVVGGAGRTIALNPETGEQRSVHAGPMWRPTVDPLGRTGAWWDGTVTPAEDGQTWLPSEGRLVLETWPEGDENSQVLAETGITDWQVGWDDEAQLLAVWTTTAAHGEPGLLSLYPLDPATGRADLDAAWLRDEPAYEGFSLQTGRLTWSAPAPGGDTTVQILAWSGERQGRLEILTEGGTRVVR